MKEMSQRLEDCIRGQVDPEPFSGVVCLSRGREVLFARGYGDAIRAESIPNRADTRFQIASGCKIFTAVAVCQLMERGLLELDIPFRRYTDVDFPHYAPDITIRHLLTHTSGITSYFEEDVDSDYESLWKELPMYRMREPHDFLPLFQHKKMKFPPGERFDYNDAGYILLGLVIQSMTGKHFATYITRNVLDRAEMRDSGFFFTDRLPERTAYAYIRNADGSWRANFFAVPIVGAPDGGVYASAPDMIGFWQALRDHRLLLSDTTAFLLESHVATSHPPPYAHYGLGVWIDRSGTTVRKFFVEGSDPGVAFRSALYPERDLVLTLLGNTAGALWPLYRRLEAVLDL